MRGAIANPRLWITFFSVLAVTYMGLSYIKRESPGEISTVHSRESDLDGGQRCASCHGGWFSNMAKACFDCHEDISIQVQDSTGLHGTFGKEDGDWLRLTLWSCLRLVDT